MNCNLNREMARKPIHASLGFCLLLCLLLCLIPLAASTQQVPTTLIREDRIKIFDQVWRAINDNYYDRNFHGVDWRMQRDIFRQQAETSANSAELYQVLRHMIGKLGDAHTRIYSPEDGFDRFRPSGTTVGLIIRRIEGKPVVAWVEPGSEAYRLGIRAGFSVSLVDGVPIETVLDRIRGEVGVSSTPTALELQSFDRIFYGPRETPVAITFTDGEGKKWPVSLMRKYVEFQRRVVFRELSNRIGYIELTGFGPEIEKEFDQAMQSAQGTRGLILDLRNNGGGFVTTVAQTASYFFNEETDLGEFITRQGRSTRRRTQRLRTTYREPLAVLVSARSASGSEIFAAAMQERGRAMIIGTNPTTCGCLLGVSRTLKLLDGGKLNISDTDFRTAMGRRIEGSGVRPDYLIDLRASDLLAGRDRALEAATDQITRLVAFGSRGARIDFKLMVPYIEMSSSSQTSPTSQLKQ